MWVFRLFYYTVTKSQTLTFHFFIKNFIKRDIKIFQTLNKLFLRIIINFFFFHFLFQWVMITVGQTHRNSGNLITFIIAFLFIFFYIVNFTCGTYFIRWVSFNPLNTDYFGKISERISFILVSLFFILTFIHPTFTCLSFWSNIALFIR